MPSEKLDAISTMAVLCASSRRKVKQRGALLLFGPCLDMATALWIHHVPHAYGDHMAEHRTKLRVLLPKAYNDGRPVEPALLTLFEEVLTAIAGAWSSPGVLRGVWVSPDGTCHSDVNCVYEIAIGDGQVDQLVGIFHAFGRVLRQHSVYYEMDRSVEIRIEPVAPEILSQAAPKGVQDSVASNGHDQGDASLNIGQERDGR